VEILGVTMYVPHFLRTESGDRLEREFGFKKERKKEKREKIRRFPLTLIIVSETDSAKQHPLKSINYFDRGPKNGIESNRI
jgi:hypothetical protein